MKASARLWIAWRVPMIGMLTVLMIAGLVTSASPVLARVQTLTGNYTYSWADVRPTDGGPLTFERTYNSADPRTSTLGPGWTFNFNVRLVRPNGMGPGDFMFVGPQGRQDLYTAVADGQWQPSPTAQGRLTRQQTTHTVTQDDGTVYSFNEGGQPYQITFPDKSTVSLTFNAQSRLQQVTAQPTGKSLLRFDYSEDGSRLISVREGGEQPRTVHFGYDDLGRLASATDRVGNVTGYTYHGETSRLYEIIDARGHIALTMEYDENGRTLRQANARGLDEGKWITFAYETLANGTRQATMTHPPSSFAPTVPTKIIDTYDEQQRISTRVTESGPDDEPLVETYGPMARQPWGVVSRTGGQTPDPAAGGQRLAEVELPGNQMGGPIKIGQPLLSHPIGAPRVDALPRQHLDAIRRYAVESSTDRHGRLVGVLLPESAARLAGTWRIEYDDADRIVALVQRAGEDRRTAYRYDEVGNLVEIVLPDGVVRQFAYGNRDSMTLFTEANGETTQYEYDERFRVARLVESAADGVVTRSFEYEYDGLGRLRVARDLTDPSAPVITELSYDLLTVTGLWRR